MISKLVKINDKFSIGAGQPLTIIAGPCQIESAEHCQMIATRVQEIAAEFPVNLVFKASYDKANRTSLSGKRGVGIEYGLEILGNIKSKLNVPVISDIHLPDQAKIASEVLDILQIPAFLCRQTDLLISAGETGKAINLKKGQFLAAPDLKYAIDKIASSNGNDQVLLCERGTSFGYRDLIVDFRNFQIMKDLGHPVVYDATHSVQIMGGAEGKSSGNRQYVANLSAAAVAFGIDALFLEVHDNPDQAPSDGPNMINFLQFQELLKRVTKIRALS